MTALPAATDFTGGAVTEADFKTAITDLRAFLAGVVGTAGTQADALTALGALCHDTLAKTGAYTVTTSDRGKAINATTGTWTLTLPTVASAGDGFAFVLINSGSGIITLDGNASETVDGATTKAIAAGTAVIVHCNGIAWYTLGSPAASAGRLLRVTTFTANGTWTKGSDVVSIVAHAYGGGGGGASAGSGGAAGAEAWAYTASPAASYAVTIGSGGAGASSGSTSAGSTGGTTSVGALLSASGGPGGGVQANLTTAATFGPAGGPGGSARGPGGAGGGYGGAAGTAAAANSGAGGGGASINASTTYAGGAGGSGYVEIYEFS